MHSRSFRLWKTISLLIVAALVVSFAATQPTQAQEKVELTFWKHSHPPADELTKVIIDEYMKANPNVTITLELIPSDQWQNKVTTAAAGDQLPDIWDTNDANHAIFTSRGLLAPVDATAFGFKDQADLEANYVTDSLNPFKGADGQIYGIPFEYNSWTMVINDKIFREAGLDPEKDYPKTWEEVGTIGAKLAKVTDGKFERQGFAWNLLTPGWTMLLYSPLVYQLGGSILSEDDKGKTCALNSPEGIKALETMQDMYYKYNAGAPGINLSTGQNAMVDFVQERVGMWILGPWAVPTFNENPEVVANYRIIPLPQMPDAKRNVVMLSSWVWVVTAKSSDAKKAEAWKFVNYAQQQGARWLPAAGYILPRLGWTDAPEAKEFRGLDTFISQMEFGRPRLVHPNGGKIFAAIHAAVQEAVLNKQPAADVLARACDEINELASQ
jgi:ABC-type glycerol-3-phosphate transport system substrate-binding protein